jgi:hypothetical protein
MPTNSDATTRTVFWTDWSADRDGASDGRSRYGAYLRQRASWFDADDGSAQFAVLCAEVAASPIMAPPYLCADGRVWGWSAYRDDDGYRALDVSLAAPLPAGLSGVADRWAGWRRIDVAGRELWTTPDAGCGPAAWTRVTVRVPVADEFLPLPVYDAFGVPEVEAARRSVAAVCRLLNDSLADVVAGLDR